MARNKYGAQKTIIGGIRFDSKGEGMQSLVYRQQEQNGDITDLKYQVAYELQPKFKVGKKNIPAIKITWDYQFIRNGQVTVADFKGVRTRDFQLRMKLFLFKYPHIAVEIVTKKDSTLYPARAA